MKEDKVQTVFILIPQLRNIIFVWSLGLLIFAFLKYNSILHIGSGKNGDGEYSQAILYLRDSFAEKVMAHFSDPL